MMKMMKWKELLLKVFEKKKNVKSNNKYLKNLPKSKSIQKYQSLEKLLKNSNLHPFNLFKR